MITPDTQARIMGMSRGDYLSDFQRVAEDLGPNQLAWLRERIPAFAVAEAAVMASDNHAETMNAKARGQ